MTRAEFMRMLATDGGGEADAGAVGGGPARGPRGAPNGYGPTGISRARISYPVIVYMHYGCDIMHS